MREEHTTNSAIGKRVQALQAQSGTCLLGALDAPPPSVAENLV